MWLAVAEILDVAVGAEADVIDQVPAVVIGIVVDYDLVGGPIPVVTKAVVKGCHAEVEAAEPEAFAVAAFDVPLMAAADAACEAAMLPGMIEVIVRIIAPGIVADPLIVGVNVRGLGVSFFVGIFRRFLWGNVLRRAGWSGPASRNMAVAHIVRRRSATVFFFFLRESRNRTDQEQRKNA